MILGSATLTTVASSTTMKDPHMAAMVTSQRYAGFSGVLENCVFIIQLCQKYGICGIDPSIWSNVTLRLTSTLGFWPVCVQATVMLV
jgi:hypothetical protein